MPFETDSDLLGMGYEYAEVLKYWYMVGHGNKLSPYLGFPWLKLTAGLFSTLLSPSSNSSISIVSQRLFLSFTHREVPPLLATALGLFNAAFERSPETLSTSRSNYGRAWKMAELIPFLGHIGIEKLTCDASSGAIGAIRLDEEASKTTEFVSGIANSAPRPIPRCQDGAGASCSFEGFSAFVRGGMLRYGDFHGACVSHKPVPGDGKELRGKTVVWR